MLLNQFLKEHRTVQELRSIVAKQEAQRRKTAKANWSTYCGPTESERAAWSKERCTANSGQQSV